MKKITIYAPVDGFVKSLKELNDGVFSENMLGEGCYIEPKSNVFYSPVKTGKLGQIFDTKHAYFFETSDGINILMHIGLDTVNLNGSPFKTKISSNSKVDLKTAIVEVDFDLIEQRNISKNTPIVMDTNLNSSYKFRLTKTGLVKHGEPIGEYIFEAKSNITKELTTAEKVQILLNTKGKYELVAEKIYELVGTNSNYVKVFNCMTRLRFEIKNRDLVDETAILKIPIVKGVVWAGNQCQIVIGGEVYKVKDAVENYVTKLSLGTTAINTKKQPKIKRFMVAVTSIILPGLPILMTAGLLMGLKAILVLSGVIVDMGIGAGGPINMDVDTFSAFINIAAETGLKLLGIFIGYNTMKWLGGSTIMQLFVSLAIAGATLGQGNLPELVIFNINGFIVKAGMYTTSIIPHIVSAFLLFYLDRWIKTWMPTTIDVLFRPLLSFIIVYTAVFFVFGPILYIIEQGIAYVVNLATKIPFGIGVMIFCIVWQPLVLTGMHVAVFMPIGINVAQGIPSTLLALNIAVFAQLGAVIGVAVRTKNLKLRVASIATIPGAIVGVTEPILYGINLPKWRPFLAGIIASGIFGLISGMLAIEARIPGGLGIFGFTGAMGEPVTEGLIQSVNNIFTGIPNSLVLNTVLWLVINLGVIPCGIVFSYFMYEERKNEKKEISKINKMLIGYYSLSLGIKKNEAKEALQPHLQAIESLVTIADIDKIKLIENELVKITTVGVQLEKAIINNEKEKAAIIKKVKIMHTKNVQDEDAINELLTKFEMLSDNQKVNELEQKLELLNEQNNRNMLWLKNWQEQVFSKIEINLDDISISAKNSELKNLNTWYWNAIHSLDINYMINESLINEIDKKALRKK
ncbi:hypothetical protein CXP39_03715 [Mesoplasma syrphidae]|uniref:PTS beta-glucoside transporter subunit EIIBCA n=1 Tax=Mesoplasma syrphidae TaxID=225999 RepID=A0A2K9BS96_9MOLU|nr:PTS glucose transporter subunit IIABC [Mesoplasma syrphidae]AUF83872.1 hypothetical protein CXP39_03715 [Mesoplasma syrphidae]